MTESTHVTLLRRMTRSHDLAVAEDPPTASRAVRLALTKAANDTVGLVLTVLGVAEEATTLDDMLDSLGDDLLLVGLEKGEELYGLAALDMQLRAAIVEMQTMGALVGQKAEDRAPTRTDKTLSDPLLDAFLAAFPGAVFGTPLEGWMDNVTHSDQIDSPRAAGLVLADVNYRIVRMSVDLGIADRHGMLTLVLPVMQEAEPVKTEQPVAVDWERSFGEAVSEAKACFDALLHKFTVPLATAQSLEVGSILALPGCTVNSVRLIASDGLCVGQAKLGQAGGYRAVRLEEAPEAQLSELAAHGTISTGSVEDVGNLNDQTSIDAIIDQGIELPIDLPDINLTAKDDGGLGAFPELAIPNMEENDAT
jgi:flagellar motor switch protein FliM